MQRDGTGWASTGLVVEWLVSLTGMRKATRLLWWAIPLERSCWWRNPISRMWLAIFGPASAMGRGGPEIFTRWIRRWMPRTLATTNTAFTANASITSFTTTKYQPLDRK